MRRKLELIGKGLARLGMEKEALCIAYLAIIDIAAESAETRHVFEMCENWKRLGHMVTLFVPDARGEAFGGSQYSDGQNGDVSTEDGLFAHPCI
jgi:hypothetical protein